MKTTSAALLLLVFSATLVLGQKPKPPEPDSLAKTSSSATTPEGSPAEKYFSDVELINQDGEKVRFYSDVLKNKVVVINTFFTTCTSICPPMNRNFEKIQEALGDRLGKDVFLVSITVDPGTDTPTRLKEYARRFHARPGWLFLTGKRKCRLGAVQVGPVRRDQRQSHQHLHHRQRTQRTLEEGNGPGKGRGVDQDR
jgi:cytochrome oxidase Cu insertion factor (SCO1/SenC/PrrC family)